MVGVNPDFIGAGWAFPVGTDVTGGVALVAREREIDQSIRIILGTSPGERPMRPEFGCRIHEHVFGPANGATAGQIAYAVREALERWEPRIVLGEIGVSFDAVESGKLFVDVSYVIAGANDPRNLVFPFYTIPDHDTAGVTTGRTSLTTGSGSVAANATPVPAGAGGR